MKHLPIAPSKLAAFCEANGIRKLSLFGSQLHGTARPDSDGELREFRRHRRTLRAGLDYVEG
jgi:predicted nucleotidyltransferase